MSRPAVVLLAALVMAGALAVDAPPVDLGEATRAGGSARVDQSPAAGLVEDRVGRGGDGVVLPSGAGSSRATSTTTATHRWRWPLAARPPVLRRFRAPPSPYAAGHRGLDLGTTTGSRVLAVADGVVTHAGSVAGRGTVTVLHDDGLRSTYEPVAASVARGDPVRAGQVIGVVSSAAARASPHCGARVCLHLGARRGEGYVDPWPLLAGGRVRLLPSR